MQRIKVVWSWENEEDEASIFYYNTGKLEINVEAFSSPPSVSIFIPENKMKELYLKMKEHYDNNTTEEQHD